MDRKTALQRLKKLAQEQHEILSSLAQMEPPATNLPISQPGHGQEANHILEALPPAVKATVDRLEVPAGTGEVKVKFHPGRGTQSAYDAIMNTVTSLQKQNVLAGSTYKVTAV